MSEHLDTLADEALASMAQKGDRAAFEALCDRHLPCVYNRLRALLPPEAVEDVTQEVFIAVVRGLRHYRGRSSFRTWLAAVTRHKVVDYYRRRGRRPESVPFDSYGGSPTSSDEWEERALVRAALISLPDHYREILLLRFVEGLPFAEIASALHISLEATKSRYRRAIAAAAQEMGITARKTGDEDASV
mgnify:CR=1 FL=1